MNLFGGSIEAGYAMGRYTFTLPSARRSMRRCASPSTAVGNTAGDDHETHDAGFTGIRNFETGEVDGQEVASFTSAWYSNNVPGEDHVTSDQKAQAWALRRRGWDAPAGLQKVKLTYKYGRLDY